MALKKRESAQSASARLTHSPDPSLPADSQASPSSETSWRLLIVSFPAWFSRQPTYFNDVADPLTVKAGPPAVMIGRQRISGAQDSPAKTYQSLESEKDLKMEKDQSSRSHSSTLWSDSDLGGSCWKTSRVSSLPTTEGISLSSSVKWTNSGMVFRGELLTLASSESPKGAVEYSLSRVLEATAPERFFLSAKAAAGILRRAGRRGRNLPKALSEALTSLARSYPDTTRDLQAPLKMDSSSSLPPSPEADSAEGLDQTITTPKEISSSLVRRLTPVECERLMGWPEGWTIPTTEQWVPRSRVKKTSQ